MKARVLVIEDDQALADLMVLYLEREGLECHIAPSAEAALPIMEQNEIDLILLDINLPGMDGFEFLQELRTHCTVPIIIVSARETEEDIITGLSMGADEYITKPVAPRVLVARVRALLRRMHMQNNDEAGRRETQFGPYTIDFDACMLMQGSERVPLSAREFDVLAFLVENAGKTYAPEEIYTQVWGQQYGDITTIGVYIQRLRKKIEANPAEPRYLITVKGKGYLFSYDN